MDAFALSACRLLLAAFHSLFNVFSKFFENILNALTDFGLFLWYLDDGYLNIRYHKDTNKIINTLIIVLILMFILLILGLTPWSSLYGIKVFDTFNTWLTKLAIQKKVIFITLLVLISLYLTIKFKDKKKVIIPTVIITLILVLGMVFSKQLGIKALHKYLTGTYTLTGLFASTPVNLLNITIATSQY